MTIAEDFLEDIIAHPEDDTPRMIYADWLDDNDQPERAEFIRVQCRIAALDLVMSGDDCGSPDCSGCTERLPLRCRVREIRRGGMWWIDLGKIRTDVVFRRGFIHAVRFSCDDWIEYGPAIVCGHPIERVDLSDKEPFHAVHQDCEFWRWFSDAQEPRTGEREEIPPAIFELLYEHGFKREVRDGGPYSFASATNAKEALSAACLTWARLPGSQR